MIITTDRDDSTVLATLNVRQLNPDTYIVAAVREADNVQLVRQSGADSVVTSSDAVGRLLGLSSLSPTLGAVMEDLLTYGEGLEVAERDLLVPRGRQAAAVVAGPGDRGGPGRQVHRYFDPVGDPAGARRPAGRRTPGGGAALGAAAGHPRRGDHRRGGLSRAGARVGQRAAVSASSALS